MFEEEEIVEIGTSACMSVLLFLVGLLMKKLNRHEFVVGDDCSGTVMG
jgi:hypothetical protein